MIKGWDVTHATELHNVFRTCTSINISHGIGSIYGWDLSTPIKDFKREERKQKLKRLNAIYVLSNLIDDIKTNRQ